MSNVLKCRSCETENSLYRLTCRNCSAYLRVRIFNVDLWDILTKLIESPTLAFTRIIQAEHKNFIFFILILTVVKLSINSVFMSLWISGNDFYFGNILVIYSINAGILLLAILLVTLFFYYFMKNKGNKTRFIDDISIVTYSLIPYILGLILLFPVELILFGNTVFSVNPHPFMIKENFAYVMLSFEMLFLLWSVFLLFAAFFTQSNNKIVSFLFAIIFNLFIYSSLYLTSKYIFIYEL
jgi:hypothetical protein